MRLILKKPLLNRIEAAIRAAKRDEEEVEAIELTLPEAEQVRRELGYHRVTTAGEHTTLFGYPVRVVSTKACTCSATGPCFNCR